MIGHDVLQGRSPQSISANIISDTSSTSDTTAVVNSMKENSRVSQDDDSLYPQRATLWTNLTSSSSSPPYAKGLELLSSASLISEMASGFVIGSRTRCRNSDTGSTNSFSESSYSDHSEDLQLSKQLDCAKQSGYNLEEGKNAPVYIEDGIHEYDILCGRGGRSNNHPGNKRYRQVVNDMRIMYQNTEAKTIKTDLSRAIVDHCCGYGARFLKMDHTTGHYYVLTKSEARKKTSQALRETKDLKWTSSKTSIQI